METTNSCRPDTYTPDYLADKACDFITRNKERPFLVYYPMLLTHAPFVRTPRSKDPTIKGQDAFAEMVAQTDEIVGRIDRHLDKLGLSENTLLIFTADNGTHRSLSSMRGATKIPGGKATPLDAGTHVPLICKWKSKIPPSSRSDRLIDFTDFLPTIAKVAGTNVSSIESPDLDGLSFAHNLWGEAGIDRKFVYCHYDCEWGRFPAVRFARDQQYKLYDDGRLLNVSHDVFELQPIDSNDNDREVAAARTELAKQLERFPPLPAAAAVPGPRTDHPSERPNIIFLMADDLGWGDVGFNGNAIIRTPHLDAMANDGLTLDRFYAAAPVCSPTRGSCLTGRHPYRYGIRGANQGHLRQRETTVAELLQSHGYQTGHFGKWHLGTLVNDFSGKGPNRKPRQNYLPPNRAGFDQWFSTEYAVATWNPYDPANAHTPKFAGDPRILYWKNGVNVTGGLQGDDSRIIMDEALPFMQSSIKEDKPFFAAVWFHAPHQPVIAGPKYRELYAAQPENAQHYFGCITAMDDQIGRLRQFLTDQGIAENTLIFFCSDNGPEGRQQGEGPHWGSSGPYRGRKRSLYEGGVRVPAFIHWPSRINGGDRSDVACVTSDYFPTIAEIVGADLDAVRHCDGMSMIQVLDGQRKRRRRPIGFQSGRMRTWVEDQYKLVLLPDGKTELYDLIKDPGERKDLAPAMQGRVSRMRRDLEGWIEDCEEDATRY